MSRDNRRKKRVLVRTLDGPFGPIQLRHDRWPTRVVEVSVGEQLTVRIAPNRGEHGAMAVNGQRVSLSQPGRWQLRRASHIRRAAAVGRSYELQPTGLRTSRLMRDGLRIAEAHGTLAAYSPWRTIPGVDARLTWHGGVDQTDVAIGQAMVIGFGAGAPGVILTLVSVVFSIFAWWP